MFCKKGSSSHNPKNFKWEDINLMIDEIVNIKDFQRSHIELETDNIIDEIE